MKKMSKVLGIFTLVAIIGFAMIACDGGGKTLVSIAVTTQPTKDVYDIGEELNTAGMIVTATYSDGSTGEVTGYDVSALDSTTEGEKTITVSYQGKTITFTVTVSKSGFVVTFNKNHNDAADWTEANPGTIKVLVPAVNVSAMPQAPTRTGYACISWNTEADGSGSIFTETTFVTADITVYAQWKEVPAGTILVTTNADSGDGSLRKAVTDAATGSTIFINNGIGTINLASRLTIGKNLTIQGNGVTITKAASWTSTSTDTQLVNISAGTVTISRVWFKDGRATDYGAAIRNNGILTLESCVFSGNQTSANLAYGGAIYNSATMNLKGCTFFNNQSSGSGGAVYNSSGTLTLVGNLFYGNTASSSSSSPVVRYSGTVTSGGYNVVDIALGTTSTQSGWTAGTGDKTISDMPISLVTLRLLSDSPAKSVLTTLPENYPSLDFYGANITAGAAAGAVQASVKGSGYFLNVTVNNPEGGSVAVSPLNEDYIFTSVTLTAAAASDRAFSHWLVDDIAKSDNPLTLTLDSNTTAKAVFTRVLTVNSAADTNTAGTFRYALTNAQEGDTIRFNAAYTIALGSALPRITANIPIYGNGSTLTRAASWTVINNDSQLLDIRNADVSISRLWFKDGKASAYGAAIYTTGGTLTLESCIFSGNQTIGSYGGAVYNSGNMTLKGCTFYNNQSGGSGGAVFNSSGTLTLVGNLFYGNTATSGGPVVYRSAGTVTSGGYNVVDVTLGTTSAQSGWTSATGDKTINVMPMSPVTFKLTSDSPAKSVLTTLPENYPSLDFYGASITAGASAGAVQASLSSNSGYFLDLSVSNSALGSASSSPTPNADGYVTAGSVTLTATPNAGGLFSYWLVNGTQQTTTPYTFTISGNTIVKAVFVRGVTNNGDNETTAGTLRYALTNAQTGDTIRFNSAYTIALGSRLTASASNVTIEGNGSTITRATSWTATSSTSQLLYVSGSNVTINNIHFKGGRATDKGAAINLIGDYLYLNSCIFSDNQTSSTAATGGAIYVYGYTYLNGCTFFNNKSGGQGGALYQDMSRTVTLTGNLFYGNTAKDASSGPNIYRGGSSVTSNGYNVSDTTLVAVSSGTWSDNANDKTLSALSITGAPFDTTTFVPVAGLKTVMPASAISGFPTTDFNNATRDWPGAPGAVK